MDLKKSQEFSKKCEPNIIRNKEITYDKSGIPILTDDEIKYFMDLHKKNQEP